MSLWLARRTSADSGTVFGTVKGVFSTRKFVRRVIGERKLFGLVWRSYRSDEEDDVDQAVEILKFDNGKHGWKVFLGGHDDWMKFTRLRGLVVDRLASAAPVYAIRITQGDCKLPGFMCGDQLIIPLFQHKQTVIIREVLV